MKNRGLLSRTSASPLGTHKDPIPTDLPNRQVAGPAEEQVPFERMEHRAIPGGQQPTKMPDPVADTASHTPPSNLTKRHTLILKLDAGLLHHIGASLAQLDPASKSAAKREMVRAFRTSVPTMPLRPQPTFAIADLVPYRIDIRLSDDLVVQIISASSAGPFEARSAVLARFLSPHFNRFLEEAFARPGKPVTTPLAGSDEPETLRRASQI